MACFTPEGDSFWSDQILSNAPAQAWSRVFLADDPLDIGSSFSICAKERDSDDVSCWSPMSRVVSLGSGPSQVAQSIDGFCEISSAGVLYCPIGTFAATTPSTRLYKTVVLRDTMLFALGTDGTVTVPYDQIALPSAFYTQMSAGYQQVCAVRQDQALVCSPGVLPSSLATGQYTQVALTYYGSVCAIRVDQTLACSADLSPPSGQFTRIVGSTSAMCGIRTDGSIACWGSSAPLPAAGW